MPPKSFNAHATPPSRLPPPQDDEAVDRAEQQARTVTYGVGTLAGVVIVVLIFLLCSRMLF